MSAAVFRGDEIVWSDALGLADVDAGEEVTLDHQYRVGSITKTFTAAAIMQLRDAGKLDLDDPLGRHVPESQHEGPTDPPRAPAHHSGLQRETPGEVWESMESPPVDELLAMLGETRARAHAGNGVALLEPRLRVARPGRRPLLGLDRTSDYVSERLLEPVGLTRTTWSAAPPVARGYFVDPYADLVHAERFDVDLRSSNSTGGLWSTTGDLCPVGSLSDRARIRACSTRSPSPRCTRCR